MHPKPTPLAALAAAALTMALAACQPDTRPSAGADSAERPVARTWRYAGVVLPPDPGDESAAPMGGLMYQGRMQDALARLAAQPRQFPVILYLHSCGALSATFWKLADRYALQGYVSVAPNSFARPNRKKTCGTGSYRHPGSDRTERLRKEEVAYARDQLHTHAWVKQSHVYLFGFSEGAAIVHRSSEPDLRGRVALAVGCRGPTQSRRPRPATQPILTIKAKHDPVQENTRLCPITRHPLSDAYEIDSDVHDISHDPRVLQAIDAFLAATG